MNKITPAMQAVIDKMNNGWELGAYAGWRSSPTTYNLSGRAACHCSSGITKSVL